MKEIFKKYYKKVNYLLRTMSVAEKVSQMFLARYPQSNVDNEILKEQPGGYIMFGRDFDGQTPESIRNTLSNHQTNSKIKMFFAVDEEGGTVCRVSRHSAFRAERFKSPQILYAEGGLKKVLEDSREKSNLLKSLGINVNLAPVVDIPTHETSFMYKRSFGLDVFTTTMFASCLVQEMNASNIISCMKHFPGYGDNVDTHTGIAIDTRDYKELSNKDFLPFAEGIEAGVPMILVNHNVVSCIDSIYPASLSPKVHEVLRHQLHFTGLIVTDDLKMDAVKIYAKHGEAAVQAVLSGNDLIISSNFTAQKHEVLKAVESGKIPTRLIDIAVRRILSCKMYYGIL